jgi:hypothetical protein
MKEARLSPSVVHKCLATFKTSRDAGFFMRKAE